MWLKVQHHIDSDPPHPLTLSENIIKILKNKKIRIGAFKFHHFFEVKVTQHEKHTHFDIYMKKNYFSLFLFAFSS